MPVAHCKGTRAGSEQGLASSLCAPRPAVSVDKGELLSKWHEVPYGLEATRGGQEEDDPGFLTEGR